MAEEKKGFFRRLADGLAKTRNNIVSGMDAIFNGFSDIDDDFYDEIGLSEAEVGEHLGWDIDNGKGYIDLDFSTQLADDGTPCLVVGHNHPPIYLW